MKYAVEYMLKWETKWRRTMDQPLEYLGVQESELWKNPAMAATRCIAYWEETRLLNEAELKEMAVGQP
jgi:hypothetical protein